MKTLHFDDPWICPECMTRVVQKIIPVVVLGRHVGMHPARICANGHEFLDEEVVAKIYREGAAGDRAGRPRA